MKKWKKIPLKKVFFFFILFFNGIFIFIFELEVMKKKYVSNSLTRKQIELGLLFLDMFATVTQV
jgi:hypothetical protein